MFGLYQVAITLFKKKKKTKNSTFLSTSGNPTRHIQFAEVTDPAVTCEGAGAPPCARGRGSRQQAAGGLPGECGLSGRRPRLGPAALGATCAQGAEACPLSAGAVFFLFVSFFGVTASPGRESQLLHDTGHSASGASLRRLCLVGPREAAAPVARPPLWPPRAARGLVGRHRSAPAPPTRWAAARRGGGFLTGRCSPCRCPRPAGGGRAGLCLRGLGAFQERRRGAALSP